VRPEIVMLGDSLGERGIWGELLKDDWLSRYSAARPRIGISLNYIPS